ncbi:MAG TPA: GNAT family N-acetyltransferase [Bacteroidales bacterium]|nr:GNAT family N-acetyltransferase [Bacteroidales bacterium]
MAEPIFEFCDFKNPTHLEAMGFLLNHYMEDPMGDHPPLKPEELLLLAKKLDERPHAFILLMRLDSNYVGMSTCFELLSTFKIKPYLYIHDFIVHGNFRGQRLGRKLMEKLVEISYERDYCKITLEVREDNEAALALYRKMDFVECDPKMYFWTKTLTSKS